ncbi:histidine kinase [Streptomyces sp. Z26]|uniref:sensor histidine kinase n=1 Tax=Streptomyces sp. Z26 TaxID=2500177 RepID=UPI000EF1689B|nr:histidine kinase [Streptomyces sp. Z26]RLL69226.1 sensor histidine kinase [Streptomyces sp. Z26]
MNRWLAWPLREALSGEGVPRARRVLDLLGWLSLGGWLTWRTVRDARPDLWGCVALAAVLACVAAALCAFHAATTRHRLLPALGHLSVIAAAGGCALAAGAEVTALVLWIAVAAVAMRRLPFAASLPAALVPMGGYALTGFGDLVEVVVLVGVTLLSGYTIRLDAEARGTGFQLLAQERAAREAEAESAALAERARIAREMHDILAHSLSAQLVHLEAARLLIERGGRPDAVLERVVVARGMAREGLAETRQALSALRGELVPVDEFLRTVTGHEGVRLEITGEPRPLPAEAGLAVRRVAQEALTNARKHAPGARVRVRLDYVRADEVVLEVRDTGASGPGELAASGGGYGLVGMRERAELLGGTLESGPYEGPDGRGFAVLLRVPV